MERATWHLRIRRTERALYLCFMIPLLRKPNFLGLYYQRNRKGPFLEGMTLHVSDCRYYVFIGQPRAMITSSIILDRNSVRRGTARLWRFVGSCPLFAIIFIFILKRTAWRSVPLSSLPLSMMSLGDLSPAFPWSSDFSKNPFYERKTSPKVKPTASKLSFSGFSLPSDDPTSSSSASSLSSSAAFWTTPSPPRWSIFRIWSSRVYSISRKKLTALFLLALAVVLWIVPSPRFWGHNVVKFTPSQRGGSPYQLLQPAATISSKHAPNPTKWLEQNSNDKFASQPGWNWPALPGQRSSRPRAALISLVRNSELSGIVQSMTQLEHHWNHKYNYPWIFFNDEPFSDVFKVHSTFAIESYTDAC